MKSFPNFLQMALEDEQVQASLSDPQNNKTVLIDLILQEQPLAALALLQAHPAIFFESNKRAMHGPMYWACALDCPESQYLVQHLLCLMFARAQFMDSSFDGICAVLTAQSAPVVQLQPVQAGAPTHGAAAHEATPQGTSPQANNALPLPPPHQMASTAQTIRVQKKFFQLLVGSLWQGPTLSADLALAGLFRQHQEYTQPQSALRLTKLSNPLHSLQNSLEPLTGTQSCVQEPHGPDGTDAQDAHSGTDLLDEGLSPDDISWTGCKNTIWHWALDNHSMPVLRAFIHFGLPIPIDALRLAASLGRGTACVYLFETYTASLNDAFHTVLRSLGPEHSSLLALYQISLLDLTLEIASIFDTYCARCFVNLSQKDPHQALWAQSYFHAKRESAELLVAMESASPTSKTSAFSASQKADGSMESAPLPPTGQEASGLLAAPGSSATRL